MRRDLQSDVVVDQDVNNNDDVDDGDNNVKEEDIIYFKSESRYTNFYLNNGKRLMATKNIGDYEKILDTSVFFRIHNRYIINLRHVQNINKAAGNYCEMSNGDLLPIAKRRQDQLLRFLGLK